MKKAVLIIGGILAIGIMINVFGNNEKPSEILSGTPVIQQQEVSFDQVYPTIDQYAAKVIEIQKNCLKDKRCVITKDGKMIQIQSFNKLLTDDPKIYAK